VQLFGQGYDPLGGCLVDLRECVERGCGTDGVLPGALKVRRRAAHLRRTLAGEADRDHLAPMDWVTLYALAMNEENAT
jgi:L-serine dehydratase